MNADAWGSNPFEDNDSSPFDDESVISNTSPRDTGDKKKKSKKNKKAAKKAADSYDSMYKDDRERFANDVVGDDDLRAREEALSEREQKLVAKEREVLEIEARNTPNYPPFPKWFCVEPFVHHNIDMDIPQNWKWMQRVNFIYYNAYWILLFLNVVACGVQLSLPQDIAKREDVVISFVVSIAYFIFFPTMTFYLVYWMLYQGIVKRSGLRMVLHMVFMLVHIGWDAWLTSGFYRSGGGGYTGAVDMGKAEKTDHSKALSVVIYVMAILWTIDVVVGLFLIAMSFRFWRTGGLKFSDPQEDAIKGAASNKMVQRGVMSAGRSAGSAAVSEARSNWD